MAATDNPFRVPPTTFSALLSRLHQFTLESYLQTSSTDTSTKTQDNDHPLPTQSALSNALAKLRAYEAQVAGSGIGLENVFEHLLGDIVPALGRSSVSERYYGFVTGGTTPSALLADHLVTLTDTNVQVHLPDESLSTTLEDHTLTLVLSNIFKLDPAIFAGRIFTTGATSANILGLACAREFIFQDQTSRGVGNNGSLGPSVGELGLLEAVKRAGIMGVDILSAMPHASIYKASGVLGFGRNSIIDSSRADEPWELDMDKVQACLSTAASGSGRGVIIVLSCGEVNTGRFTSGIRKLREMVDECNLTGVGRAWIHVDGAFGIFARLFVKSNGMDVVGPGDEEFRELARAVEGLEYADSITTDGHKMLNVPYDCGLFFTRRPELLHSTLSSSAPYLTGNVSASAPDKPIRHSPLTLGLENSRRFRALPVYASILAYGAQGYHGIVRNMVLHARKIAEWILSSQDYILLPAKNSPTPEILSAVFTIVLFRARDPQLNAMLKQRINFPDYNQHEDVGASDARRGTGTRMYVSGTVWAGQPAVRIAVSNWRAEPREDGPGGWGVVTKVLSDVAARWKEEQVAQN